MDSRANDNFHQIITKSNIYKIIKVNTIETGMKYALSTRYWGIKNSQNKQGIAQVLNRLTYNSKCLIYVV